MSKHTPGPWMWSPEGDESVVRIPTPEPQDFSVLGASEVMTSEDIANARLIAAAPDLLEALKEMVDMMDSGDEPGSGSEWHIQASTAIAKAEGAA